MPTTTTRTEEHQARWDEMAIPSVLDFAHTLAARSLNPGDLAVDATVGNGHDTLFLVQTVGAQGRVVGFDVQAEALEKTRERVQDEAPESTLRLVQAGHETMPNHLDDSDYGEVGAVMFNLGYLPGGDHSLTTEPETTRKALTISTELLRTGGVITVVAYTGHEGGASEAQTVRDWMATLPQDAFHALSYRFVNQRNDPPRLFAVEKRSE